MPQTHFKKDALRIVSASVSLLPFLTTLCEHLGRQEINYCSWINTILKTFCPIFSFITCHLLWPSYSSRLQASLTLTLLDSKELYVLWFFFRLFWGLWKSHLRTLAAFFDHFHQQGDSQRKLGMFSACSAMCCFEKTALDKWRTKVEVVVLKHYLVQMSRFWKSCP